MILVDDEPKWIQHLHAPTTTSLEVAQKELDTVVISSRFMHFIPDLKAKNIIVMTGQRSIKECIQAYRLGATDYRVKDFRDEYTPRTNQP